MKRNFKAIGAAVLAAAMCASFAGCAKEDNGVYVDKNGNISINESKFENHVNSAFGGGNNNSSTSSSEPEELKFVMSEDIKNADYASGYIQLNNDIFPMGGYLTAADLSRNTRTGTILVI